MVDREEDDTVEYSQRITWIFNPSKSNGLTGKEELVFPHLLMLGIIMTTMRDKPSMIGLSGEIFNAVPHKKNKKIKKNENVLIVSSKFYRIL